MLSLKISQNSLENTCAGNSFLDILNQFLLLHLRVLIGPHMFASWTRHKRYIMPRKFMPVKVKQERSWGHKLIN